ncbi:hypothetical protein BV20DRAFT_1004670 [Pilatotrama ljubarskyi]|nr:hypothetical protein BV20DRAFT_1004670 [Pilatotrama ljubarskyi]
MATVDAADSAPPPAKRIRLDEEPSVTSVQEEKAIARSTRFWFDDGNVVIVANGSMAFRIHRGVLSRHSSVFRDLFELPQPDGGLVMDGCPVVHISDPPLDLSRLLQALYDGARIFKLGERLHFEFVAALVELGHKYNIEHVKAEGLNRMKTCFCHSWSALQSTAKFLTINLNDGAKEPGLVSSSLMAVPSKDAIRAVNLVRLVDQPSMLPVAFFLCTLLPIQRLLSGSELSNGAVETLSQEDLARCLEARRTFALRAFKARERLWTTPGSDRCLHDRHCMGTIVARGRAEQQSRNVNLEYHAFMTRESIIRRLDGLCEECIKALLARQTEEMRLIWEQLPPDLGLEIPEWDAAVAP